MSTNVNQSWINEQLSRAFQDQLMYGESMMYVNPSDDPEPSITRLDPRTTTLNGSYPNNLVMDEAGSGRGLFYQLENTGRTHYTSLTEVDIREFMNNMSTTSTGIGNGQYEWQMYTGTAGYSAFNDAMQKKAKSIWFDEAEKDRSGNDIVVTKSPDYKQFVIEIFKENSKISVGTGNGSKREYDLFLKNAKRGTYINTKNIKWKYE